MERVTRTRLASFAVLVVVLASGIVLGRAWERRAGGEDDPRTEEVRRTDGARGDERDGRVERDDRADRGDRKDRRRDRRLIVDRIDLTPEQEERIDTIVDRHIQRVRTLQREFQERFEAAYEPEERAIVQDTRDAIRDVLTVEQGERYDSLLAEHDRRSRDDDRRREGDERDREGDERDREGGRGSR